MLRLGEVPDLALEVVAALGASGARRAPRARDATPPRGSRRRCARASGSSRYVRERSPRRVEAVGLVPEPEEHLLHDLLGQRAIADDAAREPERRAARGGGRPRPARPGGSGRSPRRAARRSRAAASSVFTSPIRRHVSSYSHPARSRMTPPAAAAITVPAPMDFDLPPEAETYRGRSPGVPPRARARRALPARLEPAAGRGGLRRPALAQAVGPRRRPGAAARDRRGAARRAGAPAAQPDRHRLGRADAARRRHPGAARALPPGHPRRLRALVPAVQRARRRQRPRVADDPRRARRRRVRGERPEGLDDASPTSPATGSCSRAPIATAEQHRGISYFVVDMRTPGITVAADQADGRARRVQRGVPRRRPHPAPRTSSARRTTAGAWPRSRSATSGCRSRAKGALWGIGPTANDLLDIVRAHGGVADPRVRQRLAALYIESEVLRLIRLRTVSAKVRGPRAGPRGVGAQGARRRARPARDGAGRRARGHRRACCSTGARSASTTRRGRTATSTPARSTIGGGTSEVQRNIIGERVLGLPRDP